LFCACRYDDLVILGGAFPYTLGRIEHGFRCRPDIVATNNNVSPSSYLGRIWTDSLCHDHDALDLLIKKIGENRVCLGTDYPVRVIG
jgi:aminocarboxymuconate-semialdehyde decarboxylase